MLIRLARYCMWKRDNFACVFKSTDLSCWIWGYTLVHNSALHLFVTINITKQQRSSEKQKGNVSDKIRRHQSQSQRSYLHNSSLTRHTTCSLQSPWLLWSWFCSCALDDGNKKDTDWNSGPRTTVPLPSDENEGGIINMCCLNVWHEKDFLTYEKIIYLKKCPTHPPWEVSSSFQLRSSSRFLEAWRSCAEISDLLASLFQPQFLKFLLPDVIGDCPLFTTAFLSNLSTTTMSGWSAIACQSGSGHSPAPWCVCVPFWPWSFQPKLGTDELYRVAFHVHFTFAVRCWIGLHAVVCLPMILR